MINLHTITPPNPSVAVRYFAYGGNGHAVSRAEGGYHIAHLYRQTRQTPPPFNRDGERMFQPWLEYYSLTDKTPLCKNLRSKARIIYLQPWGRLAALDCPECARIEPHGVTPEEFRNIVVNDPFNQIEWPLRRTAIDPVTGL